MLRAAKTSASAIWCVARPKNAANITISPIIRASLRRPFTSHESRYSPPLPAHPCCFSYAGQPRHATCHARRFLSMSSCFLCFAPASRMSAIAYFRGALLARAISSPGRMPAGWLCAAPAMFASIYAALVPLGNPITPPRRYARLHAARQSRYATKRQQPTPARYHHHYYILYAAVVIFVIGWLAPMTARTLDDARWR